MCDKKKSDLAFYKCSRTSRDGHLSTTATSLERTYFLADSPYIHSCFNLSTTATSPQWPPLFNSHLSTTATSLQPLLWWTVHTFTLVSTSLQPLPLYNGHLSTMATSPQKPPFCNGHFFGGHSIHSLLFQPLHNGHLSSMATSLQRRPLHSGHFPTTATSLQQSPFHNGHFSTKASSLQRPFFLADSPYVHYCFNFFTTATSLQRPLSSVPKVAVAERFNCNFPSSIANKDV